MSARVRWLGPWSVRSIVFAGIVLLACSGRKSALLDPVAPETVGAFARTDAPAGAEAGTWAFTASIDSWRAYYAAPDGRRLTIYAFLFRTPSVAGETYETSRRTLRGGGGGFTKAEGAQLGGMHGMRMEDANGEYFEYTRGCWVVILEGSGAAFEEAIHAIRWAPARANG